MSFRNKKVMAYNGDTSVTTCVCGARYNLLNEKNCSYKFKCQRGQCFWFEDRQAALSATTWYNYWEI